MAGIGDAFRYGPPKSGIAKAMGMSAPVPRYQTWPERLVQTLFGAATLPGDVYTGKVDPFSEEGIRRAADLASTITLGSGAVPVTADELRMGIKAYHGSPYDFDAFDMSKIGTGEGAQAYGRGLYFAENPEVANIYRKNLADKYNRVPAKVEVPQDNPFKDTEILVPDAARPGKVYQVDINANPDEFLDWDKPLFQQSPEVQAKLEQVLGPLPKESVLSTPWNNTVAAILKEPGSKSEDALRAAGIKGIRYKDADSRGTDAGTHNYVIFDDKHVKIEKKY